MRTGPRDEPSEERPWTIDIEITGPSLPKLVELDDNGCDCPSATGSRAGLKHVLRWENNLAATTIKSLAEATGREPHEVQTSLCEYNKYVKWWNGSANYKPRKPVGRK